MAAAELNIQHLQLQLVDTVVEIQEVLVEYHLLVLVMLAVAGERNPLAEQWDLIIQLLIVLVVLELAGV